MEKFDANEVADIKTRIAAQDDGAWIVFVSEENKDAPQDIVGCSFRYTPFLDKGHLFLVRQQTFAKKLQKLKEFNMRGDA